MNRLALLLVTCLAATAASAQQAAPLQDQMATAMEAMKTLEQVELKMLTESDVTRFIAFANDADEKDLEIDGMDDDKLPSYDDFAAKVRTNDEAMALLDKHGFTPESYRDVTLNIVLAMGAAEMKANQAEIDAAMAQLEAMKGMVPEAQYNMMVDQVLGATKAFQRAPAENVALVEKMRPELEAM